MGITFEDGKVAERFNAAVLKTVEGASPPRVRISAFPPIKNIDLVSVFFFVDEKRDKNSGKKSSTASERRTKERRSHLR